MFEISSRNLKSAVIQAMLCALALLNLGWDEMQKPEQDCLAFGTNYGRESDVLEIYAAAIEKYYIAGEKGPMMVLIIDPYKGESGETCPKGDEQDCPAQMEDNPEFRAKLPGLTYETLKDFRSQCIRSGNPLSQPLKLSKPYVVLGSDELPTAKDWPEYWKEIDARYPHNGRFISFAAPGFDHRGKQALLHMEMFGGIMAIHDYYLLLEKKNGVWEVVQEYQYLMT